ncbi:MAG TPA: ATP synthase F0 subunit B [Acidobacteriaceae bacterium]|nr:ATP synthase F0 subunit B [Acidobacteriaceae bacterium]
MKRILQYSLVFLLLPGLFSIVPRLQAQPQPASNVAKAERVDAPETNSQLESFRHSPAVQRLAHHLGLSTELTAKIFEDINSGIMIGAILWGIFLFVPRMYRKRSERLARELLNARTATAEAGERLAAVEERLSKLDIEIEAIRQQTERDAANDEKRIRESLEAEKQRLLASVDQEIEAAGAAVRRDLKKYAANLAIDRATAELHISDADDRELIRAFGQHFNPANHKEERN